MSEPVVNIERFEPVLDRIIIKEITREELLGIEKPPEGEKKQGSIFISEDTREYIDKISYGIVLKVGSEVTRYDLKAGDIITYQSFPKKFGVEIDNTGDIMSDDKYRFITQVDVLAKIGD